MKKTAQFKQKNTFPKFLEGKLKTEKLSYDKPIEVQIPYGESEWSDKILDDLILENNHHSEKKPTSGKDINISVSIEKKHSTRLDDYILISGDVDVLYPAECVRCLEATNQNLSCSFSCCFIKSSFENSPEYKDSTEIYINSQDRDLHFYKGNEIDVRAVVLEEIYVNKNHFPLHDPNCKGLCPVCGENLNLGSCKH